ncbi:ketopantoate reductase family protein [Pseudomonas sp. Marseille-QA0892]
MRMLVVGAGATGGFFGARLTQADRDVTFLVRPARAESLRTCGIQVVSPHGNSTVKPSVTTKDAIDAPFDAVLLTVKAYALEQALDDIAPAVGEHTMLLSTLNGMKHLDRMRERFGAERVVGCVCKIESTVDAEGRIVQFSKINDITYGELNGATSERIERLDAFMQGAGFGAAKSDDIVRTLWEKWTLLASLGSINCLGRGTVGEVNNTRGGRELVGRVLSEVVTAVRANGGAVSDAYVQTVQTMLTNANSRQTSSMYRDLQAGKPVEAEQIIGDLIDRANRANVATPLLDTAYVQLQVHQKHI